MDWTKISDVASIVGVIVGFLTLVAACVGVMLQRKASRERRELQRWRARQTLRDDKWVLENPGPNGLDLGPKLDFRLHQIDEVLAMKKAFTPEVKKKIRDARDALFEADNVLLKVQRMGPNRKREYFHEVFPPLKERALTTINEALIAIDADC